MQNQSLPVQKLILLYIAEKAPGIRSSQLCDAALATLSMDYFKMAAALDELVGARLIHRAVRKNEQAYDANDRKVERCDLTENGMKVLDALRSQIPAGTRRFLTDYLEERYMKRKTSDMITAIVEETENGQYLLTCRDASDRDHPFLLEMTFPTESLARKAAAAWRRRSDDILLSILNALLGGRNGAQS